MIPDIFLGAPLLKVANNLSYHICLAGVIPVFLNIIIYFKQRGCKTEGLKCKPVVAVTNRKNTPSVGNKGTVGREVIQS